MAVIYRRRNKFCKTCRERRVRTADWQRCHAAGHSVVTQERPIWWVRYVKDGRVHNISSGSTKRADAERLVPGDELPRTAPIPPVAVPELTFEQATEIICDEYRVNGRRSLRTIKSRLSHSLGATFRGRTMASIRTIDVRAYVAARQAAGAANGSINRELVILKRMFTLAIQSEVLTTRPYIPLLRESNVRRGFFEPEQYRGLREHLPAHMRPIVDIAYITGWRTPSEILPLEWRQVDFDACELRLDPGTTKNGEGRTFPFTAALRRALEAQRESADHVERTSGTRPRHVFFFTEGWKTGRRITPSGFDKAWAKARTDAKCPDRIPHDFRRTAVRNLVRAGVPERVAMQLTGHKTRNVFERYNIVNAGDLATAVTRLDTYLSTNG